MNTYIALLRGINVGGKRRLPMRELVSLLEGLGLKNIRTYIQSGNVVFQSDPPLATDLAERIGAAIQESHGFTPRVLLLDLAQFQRAVAANPFPEAEANPKSLHLYFLASTPDAPDLPALAELQRESERFILSDRVFYLHAPDGIGRSKLAERVEKLLGVPATARNWRSVCKILALAQQ